MCMRNVNAAFARIRSDLAENEIILWHGAAHRRTLENRFRYFILRNLLVFATLLAIASVIFLNKPPFALEALAGLGGVFTLRFVMFALALPQRIQNHHMGFAITNLRLISVDGRTNALNSWFNPSPDQMVIKHHKNLATITLRDPDLKLFQELYLIPNPKRVKQLLDPYQFMQTPEVEDLRFEEAERSVGKRATSQHVERPPIKPSPVKKPVSALKPGSLGKRPSPALAVKPIAPQKPLKPLQPSIKDPATA